MIRDLLVQLNGGVEVDGIYVYAEATLLVFGVLLVYIIGWQKVAPVLDNAFTKIFQAFATSRKMAARLFFCLVISPCVFICARIKFGKNTPERYFQSVVDSVLERFIGDTTAFIEVVESFNRPFTSMKEARLAAATALRSLPDPYAEIADWWTAFRQDLAERRGPKAGAAYLMRGSVLSLEICDFRTRRTANKVRKLLRDKKVSSYLLHLTRNPGGNTLEVLRILDYFADEACFELSDKAGRRHKYYLTETRCVVEVDGVEKTSWRRTGNLTGNRPIVIEVSDKTASAAEILARTLQIYRNAHVTGRDKTQTVGKKVGVDTFFLPDGSRLRLSTLRIICGRTQMPVTKGIRPRVTDFPGAIAYAEAVKAVLEEAEGMTLMLAVDRCLKLLAALSRMTQRGSLSTELYKEHLESRLEAIYRDLGIKLWLVTDHSPQWWLGVEIPGKNACFWLRGVEPRLKRTANAASRLTLAPAA
jgi:hypothetical protein